VKQTGSFPKRETWLSPGEVGKMSLEQNPSDFVQIFIVSEIPVHVFFGLGGRNTSLRETREGPAHKNDRDSQNTGAFFFFPFLNFSLLYRNCYL
jgi:hypothetical protein